MPIKVYAIVYKPIYSSSNESRVIDDGKSERDAINWLIDQKSIGNITEGRVILYKYNKILQFMN